MVQMTSEGRIWRPEFRGALLHPDRGVEVLRAYTDAGLVRFNDVIADPEGRVFAGTIGTTDQSGGLYRVVSGRASEIKVPAGACARRPLNAGGWPGRHP